MYSRDKEKLYNEIIKIFDDFESKYFGISKKAFNNGNNVIDDRQELIGTKDKENDVKDKEDEEEDEIYEEKAVVERKQEQDEENKNSDEDIFDSLFSKLTDENSDNAKKDDDEEDDDEDNNNINYSYSDGNSSYGLSGQNNTTEKRAFSHLTKKIVKEFSKKISSIHQGKIYEIYRLISEED